MNRTIRRISHFLKQYFVFSKTERKGVYALLVAIALALSSPHVYWWFKPPKLLPVTITYWPNETPSFTVHSSANQHTYATQPPHTYELFYFNPNEIDSTTWVKLGLTPRSARSVQNYLLKGGKFRKPEDVLKIYGTDSSHLHRLIPYVLLPKEETYVDRPAYAPKAAPVAIDINTADSIALVKLYGIGPRMASKIITYRSEVGGFFSVNQLAEIWGFDPLLIDELKGKIMADVTQVRYLHINQVSYEELKKHPYLRFKQAAAIVNYRKQHGPFTTANELKNVIIIPDSTIRKLEPYLRFD